MKKIKKPLSVLINYIENLYKIMQSIKMNMKVFVIFLLNMLMKKKRIFFINMNIKVKFNIFSHNRRKFQLGT